MRAVVRRPSTITSTTRVLEASIDGSGNLIIPAADLPLPHTAEFRVVLSERRPPRPRESRSPVSGGLALFAALAALITGAIAVFALHGHQWRWTGFDGNTSLWAWLQMFAQPIAFAALTVRLLTSARAWRVWRAAGIVTAVLLAIVIVAGYGWKWSWTGFDGKQLWDWLHLMLLPVVLVLLPEWVRKGEPFGPRQRLIAAALLVGFALLVIGGYDWGWTWTGFTGDSFRDWLDLMIAPFLLPISCKIVHAYNSSARATKSTNTSRERILSYNVLVR